MGELSLYNLINNYQTSYSHNSVLIFGWMTMMPFLKETIINSKPINIHIDFQRTFSNWCIGNAPNPLDINDFSSAYSLFFTSCIFKRTLFSFSFMSLVLILLFQHKVASLIRRFNMITQRFWNWRTKRCSMFKASYWQSLVVKIDHFLWTNKQY